MSECLRNAGIVYGARGEIFDPSKGMSLEEFISRTFEISNVFDEKLVMGRCICHGKKDLETDVFLSNQEDTEKFLFSKESTKPHIILIYDRPGAVDPKSEIQSDILVSAQQWEDLVGSVKELQLSVGLQKPAQNQQREQVHANVVCDACYPRDSSDAKEIVGPRFKCLDCRNFDLCSPCEAKGVETETHSNSHNMAKINTPLGRCFGSCYNATGLTGATSSTRPTRGRELVVDIPEHEQELLKMFSSVEKIREVIRGYQAYCDSQNARTAEPSRAPNPGRERRKRESSMLEVKVTQRDNLLTFSVYNSGKCTLQGGNILLLSLFEDNEQHSEFRIEGNLGPHDLAPGHKKVFHQQLLRGFPHHWVNNEPRISLLDGKNKDCVLYTGSESALFENTFQLRPPGFAHASLQCCKPLSPLVKEDDGVISSSMTNDDYSLCSSNESNGSAWEEYDFLSEDEV